MNSASRMPKSFTGSELSMRNNWADFRRRQFKAQHIISLGFWLTDMKRCYLKEDDDLILMVFFFIFFLGGVGELDRASESFEGA